MKLNQYNYLEDEFLKPDFQQLLNKTYLKTKQNLESYIETLLPNVQYEDYTSDSDFQLDDKQMEKYKTNDKIFVKHEQKFIDLPIEIMKLSTMNNFISTAEYKSIFNQQQRNHLRSFLPKGLSPKDEDQLLENLFGGQEFNFFERPMNGFLKQLKQGYFTEYREQQERLEKKIHNKYLYDYYQLIKRDIDDTTTPQNLQRLKTHLRKRQAQRRVQEIISDDSNVSEKSITNLKPDIPFSDVSGDFPTEESEIHEDQNTNKFDLVDGFSDYNDLQGHDPMGFHQFKQTQSMNSDPSSLINQMKSVQNQVKSAEWIENYRKQERDRYDHPTKPWTFTCQDGSKAVVAPVAKKINVTMSAKPRDHVLLKPERAPYITILCLVRDAAARLSNGVGTRAEICELLKESQYINEDVTPDKLSSTVSGALDRLHYMEDPCVQYDLEQKLWIYLHKERTEQYYEWQNGSDSPIKMEPKNKSKKNKRGGETQVVLNSGYQIE